MGFVVEHDDAAAELGIFVERIERIFCRWRHRSERRITKWVVISDWHRRHGTSRRNRIAIGSAQ